MTDAGYMKYYCFIDFEFTCDGKIIINETGEIKFKGKHYFKGRDLLAVGLIIMDSDFEIVKRYYRTVKPLYNSKLTDYCLALTKLKQEDIDRSHDAVFVVNEVMNILKKYEIKNVFCYGDCDIPYLKLTSARVRKAGLNYKVIESLTGKLKNISPDINKKFVSDLPMGISELCGIFSFDNNENAHNAFYDAEALAKIYRAVYCSEHNDHLRYLEYINVRT